MRKNLRLSVASGHNESLAAELTHLSRLERAAVGFYKVTSSYYKGKKKVTRFLWSLGLFKTTEEEAEGEGAIEQAMRQELDEFYVHQLLDLIFCLTLLFAFITTSGVIMHDVESWSYVDAFLWSVTTISTSGIAQLNASTKGGKGWMLFTVFFGSSLFFFACFKIISIPIANTQKRHQMAILKQFGGQMSSTTVDTLINNEFFKEIPEIRTDSESIQKGEFVLMILFLMNKINYNDVKLGIQVFENMERALRRDEHRLSSVSTALSEAELRLAYQNLLHKDSLDNRDDNRDDTGGEITSCSVEESQSESDSSIERPLLR